MSDSAPGGGGGGNKGPGGGSSDVVPGVMVRLNHVDYYGYGPPDQNCY